MVVYRLWWFPQDAVAVEHAVSIVCQFHQQSKDTDLSMQYGVERTSQDVYSDKEVWASHDNDFWDSELHEAHSNHLWWSRFWKVMSLWWDLGWFPGQCRHVGLWRRSWLLCCPFFQSSRTNTYRLYSCFTRTWLRYVRVFAVTNLSVVCLSNKLLNKSKLYRIHITVLHEIFHFCSGLDNK